MRAHTQVRPVGAGLAPRAVPRAGRNACPHGGPAIPPIRGSENQLENPQRVAGHGGSPGPVARRCSCWEEECGRVREVLPLLVERLDLGNGQSGNEFDAARRGYLLSLWFRRRVVAQQQDQMPIEKSPICACIQRESRQCAAAWPPQACRDHDQPFTGIEGEVQSTTP